MPLFIMILANKTPRFNKKNVQNIQPVHMTGSII